MLITRPAGRFRLWIFPILLSLCLGLLYGSQLPGGYSSANHGADGGDLLAAVLTGGVPHPTGYPTYLLAGALFQQLPSGDPYWKGALLSLVFSALAAGLVTSVFRRGAGETGWSALPGQAAAGLALGLAPAFWSQGVIVEVYGLQAFFTACCLLWIERVLRREAAPSNGRALAVLSALTGLGLGNHLTLLLIFPALGMAALTAWRNGLPLRRLGQNAALLAAAAGMVYLVLPLRALGSPPVNWGDPRSLSGFFWLVSGQLYHGLVFGLPAAQILPRISFLAGWLLRQFGILGVLLGLLGGALSFTRGQPQRWAHAWIFGASILFSLGYLTDDSTVYLAPALMVFALWIGAAVERLWAGDLSPLHPALGRLLVGALFISLAFTLPASYREVDPRRDTGARAYAESCLAGLPRSAIVITQADADTFPLWYIHYGLGNRPDVSLLAQGLAGFDWYAAELRRASPALDLPAPGSADWESELARQNPGRPVCRCAGVQPGSRFSLSCPSE